MFIVVQDSCTALAIAKSDAALFRGRRTHTANLVEYVVGNPYSVGSFGPRSGIASGGQGEGSGKNGGNEVHLEKVLCSR